MDFLYSIFGFLFRFIYGFINNYGVSLFLFTLFFRLILLPSTIKQQRSSAKMVRLQPKLKRIKEKYQDYNPQERQQKIQQETGELYQREGYSAMGAGCLPYLIQLPILYGLYGIIRKPLTYVLDLSEEAINAFASALEINLKTNAYGESLIISNIEKIAGQVTGFEQEIEAIRSFDFEIFGIDLGLVPQQIFELNRFAPETIGIILVPVLATIASLLTSVLSQMRQKKNNPNMENQQMMGCMMLSMPLMSAYFTWIMPVAMGMYWTLSSLIGFFQTLIIGHIYAPRKTIARNMVEETVYRRSYENTKKIAAQKNDAEISE